MATCSHPGKTLRPIESHAGKPIHAFDFAIQGSEWSLSFYQDYISPVDDHNCLMRPTCSQFSREAIREHGPAEGFLMTIDRLNRCGLDLQHYPLDTKRRRPGYLDRP